MTEDLVAKVNEIGRLLNARDETVTKSEPSSDEFDSAALLSAAHASAYFDGGGR